MKTIISFAENVCCCCGKIIVGVIGLTCIGTLGYLVYSLFNKLLQ